MVKSKLTIIELWTHQSDFVLNDIEIGIEKLNVIITDTWLWWIKFSAAAG